MFEFDVFTALHDDIKTGSFREIRSRVVISSDEFPDWRVAQQVAANMASGIHGGMCTKILPRI